MQVELNSLLPSTLIEICVCVLVGLSVGLVCVHTRPLLVSPVHAAKLFNSFDFSTAGWDDMKHAQIDRL